MCPLRMAAMLNFNISRVIYCLMTLPVVQIVAKVRFLVETCVTKNLMIIGFIHYREPSSRVCIRLLNDKVLGHYFDLSSVYGIAHGYTSTNVFQSSSILDPTSFVLCRKRGFVLSYGTCK